MKGVIIVGIILTMLSLVPGGMAHSFTDYGDVCHWDYIDSVVPYLLPDTACNNVWHTCEDCSCSYGGCGCLSTPEMFPHDANHGIPEIADDGFDNDCNGVIDDGDCDGIDDDGDGLIDEDTGSCPLKFLWVPFCWKGGSDAAFSEEVNKSMEYFYNEFNLQGCKGSFKYEIISPSQINLTCPSPMDDDEAYMCDIGLEETLKTKFAEKGLKEGNYNAIIAFTNQDICGGTAGSRYDMSFGGRLVFAEVDRPTYVWHEIGHVYHLSEEYCSVLAGGISQCNRPPDNPSYYPSINYLGSDLGCSPIPGEGCCENGLDAEGKPTYRSVCYGNYNTHQIGGNFGRCIMGKGLGEFGFCSRCLNQFRHPDSVKSPNTPNGLIPLRCDVFNSIGPQNNMMMALKVTDEGRMRVTYIDTIYGRPGLGGYSPIGQYEIFIKKQGSTIYNTKFDVYFNCNSCQYSGNEHYVGLGGVVPSDITISDSLKVVLFKTGIETSQTTLNGASPAANAGTDQCVGSTTPEGALVTLDASASSDPDGDTLIYKWSAPGVTFADPTAVKPEALFPIGSTVVTLSVSDGSGSPEQTDPVTITVSDTPSISTQPQSQTKVYGESVTFSVIAAGTPPFSYQWKKGGVEIQGATCSTYTIPSLKLSDAGSYTVNVSHDCGYRNSNAAILTVNKANTATTVTSSKNPSVFGQSAPTFTAKVAVVAPGAGIPTGTVTFKDGTKSLGSGVLSGGSATFTPSTTALSLGAHSITAVYAGDTNFIGSTSPVLTQTVNPPPKITAYVPNNGKRGAAAFKFVISGSAFQNGATVSLTKSGVPAIDATGVTVSSQKNSITCMLKIPSSAPTGSRSVLVKNPDEGTSTVSGFTVK